MSAADGRVVHTDHLQSKAKNDREDLVGPLLTQIAADVVGTLAGVSAATAGTADGADAGGPSAQAPAGRAEPKRSGLLGGLFGVHKHPARRRRRTRCRRTSIASPSPGCPARR